MLLSRGRGPARGMASSSRPLGRCARAHCAPPAGTAGPATRVCGQRERSCGPEDVETCEPPARPRPSRGPAGTRRAPRPCPQRSSRPTGTLRALGGARHSPQASCPSGPRFSPQALWGDAGSHWRGCLPDAPHSPPSPQKHVLPGGALSQRRPLQSLSKPARDDPLVPSRAPLPRETLSRGDCPAPDPSSRPVSPLDPSLLQTLPESQTGSPVFPSTCRLGHPFRLVTNPHALGHPGLTAAPLLLGRQRTLGAGRGAEPPLLPPCLRKPLSGLPRLLPGPGLPSWLKLLLILNVAADFPVFLLVGPPRFIASLQFGLAPFKPGVIVIDPDLSHSLPRNLALFSCGWSRAEETEGGSSPFQIGIFCRPCLFLISLALWV